MQIELDRVTVRPFAPEDAADLWEILGDAQTMAYLERPYDFPGTQAFLQDFCIARKGALACVCRETGKVIGYLLFHALQSGVYELGWAFNRRFWRQGYAFEALDGLIAYAFEKLGGAQGICRNHRYRAFRRPDAQAGHAQGGRSKSADAGLKRRVDGFISVRYDVRGLLGWAAADRRQRKNRR